MLTVKADMDDRSTLDKAVANSNVVFSMTSCQTHPLQTSPYAPLTSFSEQTGKRPLPSLRLPKAKILPMLVSQQVWIRSSGPHSPVSSD